VQNKCYEARQSIYPHMLARARARDKEAIAWVEFFRALGERLRVRVELPEAAALRV
jgi:hypothetical protein